MNECRPSQSNPQGGRALPPSPGHGLQPRRLGWGKDTRDKNFFDESEFCPSGKRDGLFPMTNFPKGLDKVQ